MFQNTKLSAKIKSEKTHSVISFDFLGNEQIRGKKAENFKNTKFAFSISVSSLRQGLNFSLNSVLTTEHSPLLSPQTLRR